MISHYNVTFQRERIVAEAWIEADNLYRDSIIRHFRLEEFHEANDWAELEAKKLLEDYEQTIGDDEYEG